MAVAVKAGKLAAYHQWRGRVKYGPVLASLPGDFQQGRFVQFVLRRSGSVRYGDLGGQVVRMDVDNVGALRYGTGI